MSGSASEPGRGALSSGGAMMTPSPDGLYPSWRPPDGKTAAGAINGLSILPGEGDEVVIASASDDGNVLLIRA